MQLLTAVLHLSFASAVLVLPSTATAQSDVPDGLSATDWSSIRAAYDAGRHAAYPVEEGYRARNPGQQWHTFFDGRGFTVTPDAGSWTWGMELASYGFAGEERKVSTADCVQAEGQRVTYDWDGTLQEWYVNDGRGLEHGYTVQRRPTRQAAGVDLGPLTLLLTLRGDLSPRVQEDGHGVRFLDDARATVLNYSG